MLRCVIWNTFTIRPFTNFSQRHFILLTHGALHRKKDILFHSGTPSQWLFIQRERDPFTQHPFAMTIIIFIQLHAERDNERERSPAWFWLLIWGTYGGPSSTNNIRSIIAYFCMILWPNRDCRSNSALQPPLIVVCDENFKSKLAASRSVHHRFSGSKAESWTKHQEGKATAATILEMHNTSKSDSNSKNGALYTSRNDNLLLSVLDWFSILYVC